MKVSGATVHLVTGELDGGPIVVQAAVPVRDDDTAETLAARILVEEHRIFPLAVRSVLERRWRLEGRRFVDRLDCEVPTDRCCLLDALITRITRMSFAVFFDH